MLFPINNTLTFFHIWYDLSVVEKCDMNIWSSYHITHVLLSSFHKPVYKRIVHNRYLFLSFFSSRLPWRWRHVSLYLVKKLLISFVNKVSLPIVLEKIKSFPQTLYVKRPHMDKDKIYISDERPYMDNYIWRRYVWWWFIHIQVWTR